jgi:glycosyltransferase involved in cell wall biosynthesis
VNASMLPNQNLANPGTEKVSVTIVVPCCNEESAVPFLWEKLDSVRQLLGWKYAIHLILVDDGSADGTWRVMQKLFGNDPDCTLLRQPRNLGVAAAILTGIRTAKTEIVCSIDCDCTYDPQELERLIPLLVSGVNLVTGSPYHPSGKVRDVPRWRLALSKTASSLYRCVLGQRLYTYTSCFRVYRRSAILKLDLRRSGFLGVAELIGKLDLQGSVIVECPATLAARAQGASKMKIVPVLFGHLYLLCELLALKCRRAIVDNHRTEVASAKFEESRGTTI